VTNKDLLWPLGVDDDDKRDRKREMGGVFKQCGKRKACLNRTFGLCKIVE
jgi:hypothetical protein